MPEPDAGRRPRRRARRILNAALSSPLGLLALGAALLGCDGAVNENETLTSAPGGALPATLVLHGGRVVTVDPNLPEAQAVAITEARITAVGSDAAIDAYIGPATNVVDLTIVGGRIAHAR